MTGNSCGCGTGERIQTKYSTRNPISRRLLRCFFRCFQTLLDRTEGPLLDVGAGEGDAYDYFEPRIAERGVVAVELDAACLPRLAAAAPGLRAIQGSIYHLPFEDKSFDTVTCSEVLEHLDNPDQAMDELARVSRRWLLVSVPREPIWRALNVARGAYLGRLGNTPGHVNHWSKRSFRRWVSRWADVTDVRCPLPWTVVLGRVRST